MKTYKEQVQEILSPVISGHRIPGPGMGDAQYFTGIRSDIYYNDADVNVETSLLTAEYLGVIGSPIWDFYNFEARALGAIAKNSEFGVPDIDCSSPVFKTEADLDKLKWPLENPLKAGRYPLYIAANELAAKYTGIPTSVCSAMTSPFTQACLLCGFASLMKIIKRCLTFSKRKILDGHCLSDI